MFFKKKKKDTRVIKWNKGDIVQCKYHQGWTHEHYNALPDGTDYLNYEFVLEGNVYEGDRVLESGNYYMSYRCRDVENLTRVSDHEVRWKKGARLKVVSLYSGDNDSYGVVDLEKFKNEVIVLDRDVLFTENKISFNIGYESVKFRSRCFEEIDPTLGEEKQADFKIALQKLLNEYNASFFESCGVIEARFEDNIETPDLDITEMKGQ